MIAGIRRVMTSGARSIDGLQPRQVVQTRDTSYGDRKLIEECFSARNRLSYSSVLSRCLRPALIGTKYQRVERCPGWICSKYIVDAEIKRLRRQTLRTTGRSLGREIAGLPIIGLCRIQRALERYDLRALLSCRRRRRLSVAKGGIDGLVRQVGADRLCRERLATVPHYSRQKSQVRAGQRSPIHRRLRIGRFRTIVR